MIAAHADGRLQQPQRSDGPDHADHAAQVNELALRKGGERLAALLQAMRSDAGMIGFVPRQRQ